MSDLVGWTVSLLGVSAYGPPVLLAPGPRVVEVVQGVVQTPLRLAVPGAPTLSVAETDEAAPSESRHRGGWW